MTYRLAAEGTAGTGTAPMIKLPEIGNVLSSCINDNNEGYY